jgi:hypothetical protein
MTATFAHTDQAMSPFANKGGGNESNQVANSGSTYRTSDHREEMSKESKTAQQRDSFLAILLRALGAPHI